MTTVTIAFEVSDDKIKKIERYLEDVKIWHSDFSGDELRIERGDFTEIDGEMISCVEIFHRIQDIANGH